MKVTFNETQYEFKTFYSPSNGYEVHLFKDGKVHSIYPKWNIESPEVMFDFYIDILKKNVEFDSIKVNKK